MASIHAHGKGVRVHFTREGKKGKSPTLPDADAARRWIAEQLPATMDGSMFNVIELWRNEDPSAYREEVAERLDVLVRKRGWNRPGDLTGWDMKAWVREDPAWPRPCQYLRTVLRWAARELRVPVRDEVLTWKPPKVPRRAKPPLLTDQQADLIRDAATRLGDRAFALVDYLMTYGARPITATRLRLPALDAERGELELGRLDAASGRRGEKHSGGWRHRLYLRHVESWPALTSDWFVGPAVVVAATDVPVFPHYRWNRPWRIDHGSANEMDSWYAQRIGKPLREKLGGLIGIYHLKRYAITRLFRAGVDPETIALFTGHLDTSQLMTYAVSNSELQDNALAKLEAFDSHGGSQVPKIAL